MSLLSTSAGAVQDGLFIEQRVAFLVNELEVSSREFLHHPPLDQVADIQVSLTLERG